jgi:hypothetical protein
MENISQPQFSREFMIGVGQTALIQDSQEAQKGSAIGEAGVLNTVKWLKQDGLLKEALEGLEQDNNAKLHRDKDQNITEIVFDAQHEGYAKKEIKVDLKNETVNNKKEVELEKAADGEFTEFLHAKIDAEREHDQDRPPLTKLEKDTMKALVSAIAEGDVEGIKSIFQRGPKDEKLWARVASEIAGDLQLPERFVYGKDGNRPYFAIPGIGMTGQDTKDAILIYGTGEVKVVGKDSNGVIQPGKASTEGRSAQEIIKALSAYAGSNWVESIRQIRCEFDKHERKENDLGKVSWQRMHKSYQTYTDFLCMPD